MDLDSDVRPPCPVDYDEAYHRECLKEDAPRLFDDKGNSEIELIYSTNQFRGNDVVARPDEANLIHH